MIRHRIVLLLAAFAGFAISTALAAGTHTKGTEPAHISMGATVNLADYLVPGKTTVFDFTSQYCGPCRGYTEPLKLLHTKRSDIAIVKVDINRPDHKGIDWQSPVAVQYGMQSIPSFKVYGPDGKLIAEDKGKNYAGRLMVDKWINELN